MRIVAWTALLFSLATGSLRAGDVTPPAFEPASIAYGADLEAVGQRLETGDYEAAEQLWAGLDPNAVGSASEYWFARGEVLFGQGDHAGAGLAYVRVVVYYGQSDVFGHALYRLGLIHEHLRRLDIAVRLYRQVSDLPSRVAYSEPRGQARERLAILETR